MLCDLDWSWKLSDVDVDEVNAALSADSVVGSFLPPSPHVSSHGAVGKATPIEASLEAPTESALVTTMDRLVSSVKKRLGTVRLERHDSRDSRDSRDLRGSRLLAAQSGELSDSRLSLADSAHHHSLQHSPSTRTRKTTDGGETERPESTAEIYALYVQAMERLGVNVEQVPALKNKTADEMWQLVCSAGLQERDDRHTPEYYAHFLAVETNNAHQDLVFLKSLRIALSSKPLSWNEDFARAGGWEGVLRLFVRVDETRRMETRLPAMRELVRIARAFTNNKPGIDFVFGRHAEERARESVAVLAATLALPCRPTRLCAIQILTMAVVIDERRLVPLVVAVLGAEGGRRFRALATALTEAFNATESSRDSDTFPFILDAMVFVNALVEHGYDTDDLEFRMQLRSDIFDGPLRRALPRHRVIDDGLLSRHCEAFLTRAQQDENAFMAQFGRAGDELANPLVLLQTVAEAVGEDDVTHDAFSALMLKLLRLARLRPARLRCLAAIDHLLNEAVGATRGFAIDYAEVEARCSEPGRVELLTLQRTNEKLEERLARADRRIDTLTRLQTELEQQLAAKGQRVADLAQEKTRLAEECEARAAESEQLRDEKAELERQLEEAFKKQLEETSQARMSNLTLDSPRAEEVVLMTEVPLMARVPPPPPIPLGLNAPPPPPMPFGLNAPPPPPMPFGLNAPPPPPMPFGLGAPPPPPPGLNAPVTRTRRAPREKTRVLQWDKIVLVKGTIWEELNDAHWEAELDYAGLEQTFKYETTCRPGATTERRTSYGNNSPTLMDPKRARNMQIILGGLRLSPPELRTSLLRMDEGVWSESVVHELLKYLPSAAEKEEIAKYFALPENAAVATVTAERIVFELSRIHGLEDRLLTVELKASIGDWHVEAHGQLDPLLDCIVQLRESGHLKAFLELVLAVGNFLNAGTYKANAAGFKLDGLLKIKELRAADAKSNLLVFLLGFLASKRPEMLSLPTDLMHATSASKTSLEHLTELVAEKGRLIHRLEKLVEAYRSGGWGDLNGGFDRYLQVSEPFIEQARCDLRSVQEKLQRATGCFEELARHFGDDGQFKTPRDLFSILADFSVDFDRIKQELLGAESATGSVRQRICSVLSTESGNGRGVLEDVLGAARSLC